MSFRAKRGICCSKPKQESVNVKGIELKLITENLGHRNDAIRTVQLPPHHHLDWPPRPCRHLHLRRLRQALPPGHDAAPAASHRHLTVRAADRLLPDPSASSRSVRRTHFAV